MSNKTQSKVEGRLLHLQAVAKKAGVKMTHQRLEIFRELAATEEHPDADSIFRAVQARMPTVSVDTVYRTLWMLHDLGLVTTLGPQRHGVRFDANLEPHHHYVCVRCNLVRDFESADLNALRVPEAVKELGSIAEANVQVRGVCTKCMAEQAETPSTKTPSNPRNTTP
jgi:Fur family transcriptional regulator, peroxide stress response regulator